MRTFVALVAVLVVPACGAEAGDITDGPSTTDAPSVSTSAPATMGAGGCAHVVDAEVTPEGDGTYRVAATVRSADTGWEKYADAWEVRSPDGEVLGVRKLAHPHVDTQPFTRSLSGVEIPADVDEVVIVARDSVEGFCGDAFTAPVPES